ncbi:MAG: PilZ domain-containing protein [Candidatus Omnitrophica bacterium]|nr:PilZ domain-containing protein [Candidatus Omnitrophota bacterium]
MMNRRREMRIRTHLKGQLIENDQVVGQTTISNLSKSGMRLALQNPLEHKANKSYKVRFSLPTASGVLDIDAQSAWADDNDDHEIGLKFSNIEPSEKALIGDYVDRMLATAYGIRW